MSQDLAALERTHPAKFSPEILDAFTDIIMEWLPHEGPLAVLDPFAGVGRIHDLRQRGFPSLLTVGVELEPEWAGARPGTHVGDARALPQGWTAAFDAVFTSPCYGNRMADSHNARDICKACAGSGCRVEGCLAGHPDDGQDHGLCKVCGGAGLSRRNTYKHRLGRDLSTGTATVMQWGPKYRAFHDECWLEAIRVVKPGGFLVVNISDHMRKVKGQQQRQRVVAYHLNALLRFGCNIAEVRTVATRRNRQGANYDARVDGEQIIVAVTP